MDIRIPYDMDQYWDYNDENQNFTILMMRIDVGYLFQNWSIISKAR